ncbi:4a-hydroxytetrahydrobiopterin dehydratase [Marinicella sp. S1101]|uniref:4a-hydroxytetrahydrobiopterin dehydratase n=1 Tax=Marinicella marina TaxID=2996016 RepID=UPI002260DB6F|nr:4a-hydroxytetrahydrobiopterin dehydratase [Marinicella marina]MCX7553482.1 4a-hydroxytetrahydrobiopterin dehydratase [Marinicella marina]MDJ1140106.1 4a-hydroxytetrahydrobiopterin dehydratase [Marinicella marina]
MDKQLKELKCEPCNGGVAAMTAAEAQDYHKHVNGAWQLADDAKSIHRRFKFKNFAKTMFFVNALANLADKEGHHPDVKFGYNYCEVLFTTHEAGGLTINDYICAKKVDLL